MWFLTKILCQAHFETAYQQLLQYLQLTLYLRYNTVVAVVLASSDIFVPPPLPCGDDCLILSMSADVCKLTYLYRKYKHTEKLILHYLLFISGTSSAKGQCVWRAPSTDQLKSWLVYHTRLPCKR